MVALSGDRCSVLLTAGWMADDLRVLAGVDVEGLQSGLELPLLELLGSHSPIPVTYAGGARSLEDCETVARLGRGRVGLTIGSALDIFGGALPFDEVVEWHDAQLALGPAPAASL